VTTSVPSGRAAPAVGVARLLGSRRPGWLLPTAASVLAYVVFEQLSPSPAPFGIIVLGIALGSLNALLAIGIVLVYRANRIINFAHGELGGVAAVLTVQLVFRGWNYFAAVGAGLAAAVATGALIEVLIVRRFREAPRLLLTAATIGLAQLLAFLSLIVPKWIAAPVLSNDFSTPLSGWRFTIAPVVFDGNYLLIVLAAAGAMAALGWFFARTRYGIGVRASAENADRAALCGIPNQRLSTLVWVLAAALSATAAILRAPVVGLSTGVLIGPGLLMRGLAAAVIAGMDSLPVTVAAAVGLGVVEQSVYWSYGRTSAVDVMLLAVILLGLLLRRRRTARVDAADASSWRAVTEIRPIPTELRDLPEVLLGRAIFISIACVGAILLPVWLSPSRQNLATVMVISAIIAVSFVPLTGWAGQISLGQYAIVGIGAAVAGTLSAGHGFDFLLDVLAGGAAGVGAALLLGLPALRLRGFLLAVTTLAFAVTTSSYLLHLSWLVPRGGVERPVLFGRFDLEDDRSYYYVCLTVLAAVILGLGALRRSRIGRAIVAARDNERAAKAYGVRAWGTKLTAFALSGGIAGMAGGLLVHQQHALILQQYEPAQSLQAFTMAVIGGLGSMPGAVLGAVFVNGSQNLLGGIWALFASGLGLVFVLMTLPQGLGAVIFDVRDALLRRVARRRSIVVASLLADIRERPDSADDPLPMRTDLVPPPALEAVR
jgi:branched-chain amino acid transport system permease protein